MELKLIELYQDKYSFFDVLFNEIKSIDEINNEFPQIKIDKRRGESFSGFFGNPNYTNGSNENARAAKIDLLIRLFGFLNQTNFYFFRFKSIFLIFSKIEI